MVRKGITPTHQHRPDRTGCRRRCVQPWEGSPRSAASPHQCSPLSAGRGSPVVGRPSTDLGSPRRRSTPRVLRGRSRTGHGTGGHRRLVLGIEHLPAIAGSVPDQRPDVAATGRRPSRNGSLSRSRIQPAESRQPLSYVVRTLAEPGHALRPHEPPRRSSSRPAACQRTVGITMDAGLWRVRPGDVRRFHGII